MPHSLKRRFALAVALMAPPCGIARAEPIKLDSESAVAHFLSAWSKPDIQSADVRTLYASHVVYYGRAQTREQVFAQKRAFAERWPSRRYELQPGSSAVHCDATLTHCQVTAAFTFDAESARRGAASGGRANVALELALEDDNLKIVRESGRVVARR